MAQISLNDADDAIISYLEDGRCTAAFLEQKIDWSRPYITQRLRRLEEHTLVENLEDTGLYQLSRDE